MREKIHQFILFIPVLVLVILSQVAEGQGTYKTLQEIQFAIHHLQASHAGVADLEVIGKSYGGRDLEVVTIGSSRKNLNQPGIFVIANIEGNMPLSSEAALQLIEKLLDDPTKYQGLSWYILPVANPDAYSGIFGKSPGLETGNGRVLNQDRDEAVDEDPCEDLDGDGIISMMRLVHPDGEYGVHKEDKRIMLKKTEDACSKEVYYKLFTEGIDNDGDGMYNEDPHTGIKLNKNFPEGFDHLKPESGKWAGSEPEVYAILKYVEEHPDIAMSIKFGGSDLCLFPPVMPKSTKNTGRYKIPSRYQRFLNTEPGKMYTRDQVRELLEASSFPGGEISDDFIDDIIFSGPVKDFLPDDKKWYNTFSSEYKQFLKKAGLSTDFYKTELPTAGSFENWAYFQLGIPVFSMKFFNIPISGKSKKDSLKSGKAEKKHYEKYLMDYSDNVLDGAGFIDWKSYDHPDLGKLEIGGFRSDIDAYPEYGEGLKQIGYRLPWVFKLADKLPGPDFHEYKLESKGGGFYSLTLWLKNDGALPYPVSIGKRTKHPAPLILEIKGKNLELLSGDRRTTISSLEPGKYRKIEYLIKSGEGEKIELKLSCPATVDKQMVIKTGGSK